MTRGVLSLQISRMAEDKSKTYNTRLRKKTHVSGKNVQTLVFDVPSVKDRYTGHWFDV